MIIEKATHDYETQSECDLKKTGAAAYAQHPSTEILCLGIKRGDDEPLIWVPKDKKVSTASIECFEEIICDEDVTLSAHNAFFEQVINKFVFSKYTKSKAVKRVLEKITPHRYHCTAAKAAAVAIPRNLEGAARVMKLPVQKNMRGNRLMKKYMKPRNPWKKWNAAGRVGPEPLKYFNDEFELWEIYDYCLDDVRAEDWLDRALPELSPFERKVWIINQEMNMRGIQIDLPSVNRIIAMIENQTVALQQEAKELTNGEVTSVLQRAKVLEWCQDQGAPLENLRAPHVKEVLADKDFDGPARRLLEIRQSVSKTSNKKYYAMRERAGADGRVRDLALYHGASTGRESGTGLQVHNFPRGTIDNTNYAIDVINKNDLEFIKFVYGNPFNLFSSCLRGMIKASPSYEIVAADLNAIECRVLNWLTGHKEVLRAFDNDEDPYIIMAARIFGLSHDAIDGGKRFLGKTAELGCGYQMGPDRFLKTCIEWGVPNVTPELAKKAVEIYRQTHQPVVRGWELIERAAITAVNKPGTKVTTCKTTWFVHDGFLWCRLPSDRLIAYHRPSVRQMPTPWGELRPKLYYWYVDPLTKQWVNGATYGGGLMENCCQAVARDVTVSGIVNTTDAGYRYLFQCHDEIIAEQPKGYGDLSKFIKLMVAQPKWAPGLPIRAGGWIGPRYKKD